MRAERCLAVLTENRVTKSLTGSAGSDCLRSCSKRKEGKENEKMRVIAGVLLPFLGTGTGAAFVFFMKNHINKRVERLLLGFAAGVMIAASVWSLLIPAAEMAGEQMKLSWIPCLFGFLAGVVFLMFLDMVLPDLYRKGECFQRNSQNAVRGKISYGDKNMMLLLAVTLHNLPEGMAVGAAFAGAIQERREIALAEAFVLAVGIAIQNIPEGAIISMPLCSLGMSRKRAFFWGMISGAVEPAGAVITILLTVIVLPALPYLLSFAAGAMIYVMAEELIPEAKGKEGERVGIIGVALGFAIMMTLDMALG